VRIIIDAYMRLNEENINISIDMLMNSDQAPYISTGRYLDNIITCVKLSANLIAGANTDNDK